ncbi:MAG: right-handed parallel beta-helix repeat-containing protein [Kiritimatiellae bacterium]|nr:right-handed parallel beta-helix repeat-containing protein [Kiritimatiellia bacterium]
MKKMLVPLSIPVFFAAAIVAVLPRVRAADYWSPTGPPGTDAAVMKTLDQVEPRTVITALPFAITNPGSYYMTGHLAMTSDADGITIHTNDVLIDMKGFSLLGGNHRGVAIRADADLRNIAIRNGVLKDWDEGGIAANPVYDGQLQNVLSYDNGDTDYSDIVVGKGWLITACTSYSAGSNGIYAYAFCTLRDCSVLNSGAAGIRGEYECTILDCKVYGNAVAGIYAAEHCMVKGCMVTDNTADGIVGERRNRIEGNNCAKNGTGGTGAGIHATGDGNRIESNTLNQDQTGILVDGTNNLVIRNSAFGCVVEAFDISGDSRYGEVLKAQSLPAQFTNANPWANFEF